MEQLVRVLACSPDGTARVVHVRESACSGDCHKCAGCGAAKETVEITAQNPIGASPGDLVIIRSASGPVLAAAAVLYLLPLMLFFLGYGLMVAGNLSGPLGGLLGAALGIFIAFGYDRLVLKKKKTVYTIIGYGPSAAH